MPRIRTIKPEMASSLTLSRVSIQARYTFTLLISQADDDGLQLAAPRQLLGSLYPHDAEVTESVLDCWLKELEKIGVITRRLTNAGAPVLSIRGWTEHQKIDKTKRAKPLLLEQLAPSEAPGPSASPPAPRPDPARTPPGMRSDPDRPTVDRGPTTVDPSARQRPRGAASGRQTWLSPIAEAHEEIYGAGSFPPLAGRFAKAWRELFDAHGGERCARVWAWSQHDPAERRFRTPECVAAHFGDFDPDAVVSLDGGAAA